MSSFRFHVALAAAKLSKGLIQLLGRNGTHTPGVIALKICPDFLEPSLEGEWKLKGHIRLGTILLLAFRMLLDKNVRLWIRAARGRKEKA